MNEILITSHKTWKTIFNELWKYREVFFFLGWRDILVHYKQTTIGILWVVLRPLLTVAIFTVIFSRIAGISGNGVPYALVVFAGMLPWQFFADSLTYGGLSFLSNVQLVSKVYFPRVMLPASRQLCSLVDFGVGFACYLLFSLGYYRFFPSVTVLYLPLFVVWLLVFSLSASLLFASLIVRYRDFRHILPFVVQLGMYCSPIGFSFSMVPQKLKLFLALNPMTGIVNGFRFCLLGEPFYGVAFMLSLGVTGILTFISVLYFKRAEGSFADLI
jgi:lipopolysaccharide transport system permease protein